MREIRWDSMDQFLRTGREIEFAFRSKNYSITNNPTGYWFLCRDEEKESIILDRVCPYRELDYLAEKIAETVVDGVTIRQIFDDLLYDEKNLWIG